MFGKDPRLSFNIQDPFSPHSIVPELVAEESKVLDVGCNVGYLGQYLIENKNCICDGIDYDVAFLAWAEKNGYRKTYTFDLYKSDFVLTRKYDYILFVDILEHLPNPLEILGKFVKSNLKDDGKVIISLPNIARFEYRLSHLLGNFDYEKSGIMHQDHLRFFTLDSAKQLIRQADLKINKIYPTGLGARVKIFPKLTSFQFIFVCSKR